MAEQKKPKAIMHEKWQGTCAESMVCVSENMANCILFFNIISPGSGTALASCLDENGCNCNTYGLAMLQAILVACVVGWIWAIKWACEVKTYNVARLAFIAGGGTQQV